jgi:hypothetical protein
VIQKMAALVLGSVVSLAACSSSDDLDPQSATEGAADEADQAQTEEGDSLGIVEQAIGEATCGTQAIIPTSFIMKLSGSGSLVTKDGTSPTYGTAGCTNAQLVGINVTQGKADALILYNSPAPTVATCTTAKVDVFYYKNGAQVAHKTAFGTVDTVRNVCVRPTVSFSTAEVGAPPAAQNARFAIQAVQGAVQKKVRLTSHGFN